jgi:ABC-type uncharacterized transport system substrate-binding protein
LSEITGGQIQALTRGGDLVVPVGVKAARQVAENHVGQAPVLALMIPRAVGEKLACPAGLGRKKISFAYIDQPVSRSLGLIAEAFPSASRVGVVISPENSGLAKPLLQEASRRQWTLNLENVDAADEVAGALRRVLADSDVLLLVPDALVINAANAQNVLLTTYRYRVPVVGFSQGLTKAGAVASLYSSPAQIGRQGAQMATRWLEAGELPPPQPAAEFSLSVNRHVARSLGVTSPDEAELRRKLGATE